MIKKFLALTLLALSITTGLFGWGCRRCCNGGDWWNVSEMSSSR